LKLADGGANGGDDDRFAHGFLTRANYRLADYAKSTNPSRNTLFLTNRSRNNG
jgi:hypothetical protein